MRHITVVAPLALAALAACSPAESIVAKERVADAADVAGHTWVLRRVDGAPLPARVQQSADGHAEVLADTLRFAGDTARGSGATRIVAHGPAGSHDSVYTNRIARHYRVVDGRVRIGDLPCGGPLELILCALPDTGRVRGDTLALWNAYPGAARRAYVRLGAP